MGGSSMGGGPRNMSQSQSMGGGAQGYESGGNPFLAKAFGGIGSQSNLGGMRMSTLEANEGFGVNTCKPLIEIVFPSLLLCSLLCFRSLAICHFFAFFLFFFCLSLSLPLLLGVVLLLNDFCFLFSCCFLFLVFVSILHVLLLWCHSLLYLPRSITNVFILSLYPGARTVPPK